ncbi:hypothetical protein YYC_03326 [Plasmodium yoelii 17X]|uniref:Uncharacterized protein n=1 Tax=Plasmodium yoelii 17X TaxID=1323249 RepID=V7PHW2_PLAYE|nr:hypothetical protein YYC_03326 [Plasmodium yoelii 17X]
MYIFTSNIIRIYGNKLYFPNDYPEGTIEQHPFNLCIDPEETKIPENLCISSIVIKTSWYEEELTKLGTNIAGFVIKKGDDNVQVAYINVVSNLKK